MLEQRCYAIYNYKACLREWDEIATYPNENNKEMSPPRNITNELKSAQPQHSSNVVGEPQGIKNRKEVQESFVIWILRPSLDGYSVCLIVSVLGD